ncbi:hypothetical protein SCALM49S_06739 [Streptomyces californicus]
MPVGGTLALPPGARGQRGVRLDVPGALLASGGLVAIVYGSSDAESAGWADPVVLTLFAAGVALLAVFVWWQSRAKHPMLPLHIVRDRTRAAALATMGLATVAMFGAFLFLTYYLQTILDYSPLRTGLAFLPMSVTIVVGATQIASRLLPHTAPRNLMAPGALLAAGGMLLLTRLSTNSTYATGVLPALVLLGLGMGLTFMPVYATATAGVAPKDAGVTSAVVSTFQQIGGSLGTVLLNTIASSAATRYIDAYPSRSRDLGEGMVHGFTVAAGAVGLAVADWSARSQAVVAEKRVPDVEAEFAVHGPGRAVSRRDVQQPYPEPVGGVADLAGPEVRQLPAQRMLRRHVLEHDAGDEVVPAAGTGPGP